MTKFKLLCQSCGFTLKAAAEYLEVPYETAKNWWYGERGCPDWVLVELKEWFAAQDADAEKMIGRINDMPPKDLHTISGKGNLSALYRRILELADEDTMLKIKFEERE